MFTTPPSDGHNKGKQAAGGLVKDTAAGGAVVAAAGAPMGRGVVPMRG